MNSTRPPHLFGIDLDGTLLSPGGTVTDRTRGAVHALLDAGHKVCFSTGRNLAEAHDVFVEAGHLAMAVVASGAMVADARDGRVLYRGHMQAALAAELCETIEACGEAAVALQDRTETGVDYLVTADRPQHPALRFWFAFGDRKVETRPGMASIDHTKTLRVSTVCGYAPAARVRTAVQTRFGPRVYLHSIVVASEAAEIVEIFDPAVNKWDGLSRVADVYGIPHDRTVAIGDDTNDLPMIRMAGLGVAMGNARAEVKAVAKRVIGRNDEDGLAEFLEAWLADDVASAR